MTTWTNSARRLLERYLNGTRFQVAAVDADPDEVVEDLRLHIETELARGTNRVITEREVQRVIGRVNHPSLPPAGLEVQGENETGPVPFQDRGAPQCSWKRFLLIVGGICLPLAALVIELLTGFCSIQYLNPVPTWFHAVLIGIVPLATGLALWHRFDSVAVVRAVWLIQSVATAVAAFYSVLFLPGLPFALMGVIVFGLGFLPLAPFFALSSICALRRTLRMRLGPSLTPPLRHWWLGFSLSVGALTLMALPTWLTRPLAQRVANGSSQESAQAARWLRAIGDRELLLLDSYGSRRGLIEEFIYPALPPEQARMVFYQITGQPFNAVTPPRSMLNGRNRFMLDLYEFDSAETDFGLGGSSVAGRIRGLSLIGSRIDGICEPNRGWGYLEWILEFKNDHERSPREARAQIQLPPGAVVSRLTLWVNGEEREAAFAGQAQVREAYQRVAVIQRRDPVLVTLSGPDRILVQCFPVPAGGGTMKIRLGITAPLHLDSASDASLAWPVIVERNFAPDRALTHSVWLESSSASRTSLPKFVVERSASGRWKAHGDLTDFEFNQPAPPLEFDRDPGINESTVALANGAAIRQQIVASKLPAPERIAIVVDGSREVGDAPKILAAELSQYRGKAAIGVWFAQDEAKEISAADYSNNLGPTLSGLSAVGGQDNIPALLRAWDWAAQRPDGVLLWIHGPQPVLLSSTSALVQRLQWQNDSHSPKVFDLALKPGPNRVLDDLPPSTGWINVIRRGDLASDLGRLFSAWTMGETRFEFQRELLSEVPSGLDRTDSRGSHLHRLWAKDLILLRIAQRRIAEAIALARELQLVTPVSGAVVLETAQQYEQAGLTPVHSDTVPMVPEPGSAGLVVVGVLLLWAASRYKTKLYKLRK